MTNIKSAIINTIASIFAILTIIGILNVDSIMPLISYTNAHLGGYVCFIFYSSILLTFFLLPILGGIALEVPMYESNTRIGYEFANAMTNARNGAVSFIAVGLLGGSVLFFSSWAVITMICS